MASGDTLHRFRAASSEPLGSGNAATLLARNGHLLLKFPDAATYGRAFPSVMSRRYASGGINVRLLWCAATATSGNVVWGGAVERLQVGTDLVSADSFATEKTVTSTTSGTAGVLATATITFTNSEIDGVVVGEAFRLRIQRLGSNGSDSMTDDAQLLAVEIYEV